MKMKCFLLTIAMSFLASFTSCDKEEKQDTDYWVKQLKLEQTLWEGEHYYGAGTTKGVFVKLFFLDEKRMNYSYDFQNCQTQYIRSNDRMISINVTYGPLLLDGDWIIIEASSSELTLLQNPQSIDGKRFAKLVIKKVW